MMEGGGGGGKRCRTSELPEDIVCYILESLPMREIVRTSVLSKSWRYIWTRIPIEKLIFVEDDYELVNRYLSRKCAGQPISVPVIDEANVYGCNPWELPGMESNRYKPRYFFSKLAGKYANTKTPRRKAGTGYWKTTGAEKQIGCPNPIGTTTSFVFYDGHIRKEKKTNWIMHEYRLYDVDKSAADKKKNLNIDEWVLCRIYEKQKETIILHMDTSDLVHEIPKPPRLKFLCLPSPSVKS